MPPRTSCVPQVHAVVFRKKRRSNFLLSRIQERQYKRSWFASSSFPFRKTFYSQTVSLNLCIASLLLRASRPSCRCRVLLERYRMFCPDLLDMLLGKCSQNRISIVLLLWSSVVVRRKQLSWTAFGQSYLMSAVWHCRQVLTLWFAASLDWGTQARSAAHRFISFFSQIASVSFLTSALKEAVMLDR